MNLKVINESDFQYVEQGEGPVLLLLHGLFGALSNFYEVINHFSNHYKVVIPIMPIYNLPVLQTNVKSLVNFINEFISYKKFKSINLLGNSLGGHVALIYASKYIAKVNSMILTGSSGLYENSFGNSFPRRSDKKFIRKKVEITFYDPKNATDELVDECYNIVNNKNKALKILHLVKSAIRNNMRNELSTFSFPCCLIWGKNDTITPPEVAEEFYKLLPKSDLYWINKCGHAPMMEHPQEFNRIVEKWLIKQNIT